MLTNTKRYIEVDVYRKPKLLLDINPRGLVPALRHGNWGCHESTVLLEYLEDLKTDRKLLPEDPKLRAESRLWCDHINRHIIPAFYKYLQAQEAADQVKFASELKGHISTLVDAADESGPFFLGEDMTFVDVQLAPWLVRLEKVLKPYRGKPMDGVLCRFQIDLKGNLEERLRQEVHQMLQQHPRSQRIDARCQSQ